MKSDNFEKNAEQAFSEIDIRMINKISDNLVIKHNINNREQKHHFVLGVKNKDKWKCIGVADIDFIGSEDAWKKGDPKNQVADIFAGIILDMLWNGFSPMQQMAKDVENELAHEAQKASKLGFDFKNILGGNDENKS